MLQGGPAQMIFREHGAGPDATGTDSAVLGRTGSFGRASGEGGQSPGEQSPAAGWDGALPAGSWPP